MITSSISLRSLAVALTVLATPGAARAADTILSSKHDLSLAGGGTIRSTRESEVCLFCHTPHRGSGETPLWNHQMSQASYTPYSSSTTRARIGQPTGASKLCLSCHDGTVALGMVHSRSTTIEFQGGLTTMPPGRSKLGTDLSDDHPISFRFDSALAAAHGELKDPATLQEAVKLDHNGEMQCTSCHDPHNNQFGNFLVRDNTASGLCMQCHEPRGWDTSIHRLSSKTWNGVGIDPWPFSNKTSVAANACGNCHVSHGAGTPERLLTQIDEERNCFSCHNGNVAAANIETEFNKMSIHPVFRTARVHNPLEDPLNPPRHVECADCHNAHAVTAATAQAPAASGALAGVRGVSSSGALVNGVKFEYELCYRCHADSSSRGRPVVDRQFPQTNTRLEFQAANASFHPVESPGKNPLAPSLIPPWTTGSRIYCTDCHNNDQGKGAGASGPNGPHGSIYAPLLERQLIFSEPNPENAGNYALCYKCHSRTSILNDESFSLHKKHVSGVGAACTTCHDSHGVPAVKHLINFNTRYATPSSNGRMEFVDRGALAGECSVTCHGKDHKARTYLRK